MEINKHNYEAYFLDYYEGNLTPQQVAELLLFIEQQPQLKIEFESFENILLEDYNSYEFENKKSLKKEVNAFTLDEYLIKKMEGIISSPESDLLEMYLAKNINAKKQEDLFLKTKLKPDTSIVFENKAKLKSKVQIEKQIFVSLSDSELFMLNALEGDLSDIEKGAFELKLKNDEQFKLEYNLYLQSKLQPDYAIVADFKDALKQNEDRKVIPFYYYFSSAVAAAILVILGLIYLFNQATLPVQELAKNTVVNETIKPLAKTIENKVVQEKTPSILANTTNTSPNKEKSKKIKSNDYSDLVKEPKNEIVASVQEAHFKTIDSLSLPSADKKNELGVIVPDGNTQARNFKTEEKKSNEYYSLKEMAVVKLKQKTLEEQAIEEQKKQGRLNKFNFWDLAQVVAKGINRLTNSDVSVNPEYNDSGELTAYAFNAGKLGFSKGK